MLHPRSWSCLSVRPSPCVSRCVLCGPPGPLLGRCLGRSCNALSRLVTALSRWSQWSLDLRARRTTNDASRGGRLDRAQRNREGHRLGRRQGQGRAIAIGMASAYSFNQSDRKRITQNPSNRTKNVSPTRCEVSHIGAWLRTRSHRADAPSCAPAPACLSPLAPTFPSLYCPPPSLRSRCVLSSSSSLCTTLRPRSSRDSVHACCCGPKRLASDSWAARKPPSDALAPHERGGQAQQRNAARTREAREERAEPIGDAESCSCPASSSASPSQCSRPQIPSPRSTAKCPPQRRPAPAEAAR